MKHIKKYKNHIEYLAQIDEEYFPNVSYCNAENELHYNLLGEHYGDVTKILCLYIAASLNDLNSRLKILER